MEEKETRARVNLAFLLVGGAVGATIGLLMAPRSGAETRDRITSRIKEGRESIGSSVKSAQEQLQKTSDMIGSSAQRLISKGRSVISHDGRDIVAEAIDAAKRAYLEEKDAWMLKR